ncbi:TolC family protein [uncultured Cetobacterium sp.]|uniref:TolC family protein n=1 Tax=uncultured Cetobacterium sp. TaxID=527638 RepID=UPI002627AA25|nr:TolC family protein [uncultured Cetobacterium sp.]
MKKLLGLLVILSTAAFSRELTLESAIDLALENGKTIKTSELSKENANLNVKRAFKTALPKVTYNGKYEKAEHTTRNMIIGDTIESKFKSGYTQTIGIYQPLFQGGAITGGIIGAKASKNIADIFFLAEKRDVRMNIISLYSSIINFEKDLTVLESSKKELQARYNKQSEQLNLRLLTKADLLKTEYSILDLESQITGTRTNLEVAKKDLKLKLMIPANEVLTLKEFQVPENLTSGIDFDKDLSQALTNSLSSRLATNKVNYAEAEKIVARSSLLPQVEAFGTYGTSKESHHFDNSFDNAEWRGGVAIKWDVFEFGSGIDQYNVAKNSEEIETINKDLSSDNIKLSVTRDYKELIRLQQLRDSRSKALEAARENFAIDTERYNTGLISTVDFLLSESQYRQAGVEYNAAILNYYVAFEKYRSSLI